jgi:hypothetical protein
VSVNPESVPWTADDREAIRLSRLHGIVSMATWVIGFKEETDADHWRGLRQLLSYDPDHIQLLYVTPPRWTPYFSPRCRPSDHSGRSEQVGRQASSLADPSHAALAHHHLVQIHRDGTIVPAESAVAHISPS